jgi:hypothetical protein
MLKAPLSLAKGRASLIKIALMIGTIYIVGVPDPKALYIGWGIGIGESKF